MILEDPREFAAALPAQGRIFGLDIGKKTIGIAITDTTRTVASGMENYRRTKFTEDALHLNQLAQRHDICGFVIGLPIEMDGSEGKMCQSVRQFGSWKSPYDWTPISRPPRRNSQ